MESPKAKPVGDRLLDIVFGKKDASGDAKPSTTLRPWQSVVGLALAAVWIVLLLANLANHFVTLPVVGDWLAENGRNFLAWIGIVVGLVGGVITLRRKHKGSPAKGSK